MKCQKQVGFTLIEFVIAMVVMAILAVVIIPRVTTMVSDARIRTTEKEIKELQKAILGDQDRGLFGYEEHMNAVPGVLADLFTDPGGGFDNYAQSGWNGPYVDSRDTDATGVADILEDAWCTACIYGAGGRRIYSEGPDGEDDNGADDDIVITF